MQKASQLSLFKGTYYLLFALTHNIIIRYYHLFRQHELDELIKAAGDTEILESGYDRDNWYVIFEKI